MDEPSPPPLPVPAANESPTSLPPIEPAGDAIPLATITIPPFPQQEIPFAQANVPQQFNYTTSVAYRPGLVTAIGVLAIVVACLSGIVSVIGGGQAFMFYVISNIAGQMGNMNFNTMPAQTAAVPPDTNPMSIADSGMVTTILQDRLALDGARMKELTELLHKHGSALFHTDDEDPLTAAGVRAAITESHKATDDVTSAAKFVTSQGTIEIFADRATFTSTDGNIAIQTSAQSHIDNVTATPAIAANAAAANAATMPGTALQPGDVSRAIAAIRQMQGVTVTPAQIAEIRRELSDPNQTLVIPGSPQLVYFASNLPANQLQINFNSGTLTLDTTGRVVSTVTTFNGQMGSKLTVPGKWVAVVVSECAASCLLAIYLFIVGIISLRGSLRSPRLLRIYAVPKILLAIVAGFGVATLIVQSSVNNAGTMNAGNEIAGCVLGVGVFLAGVAYPIGVLLALRNQAVRQYFSTSEANRL